MSRSFPLLLCLLTACMTAGADETPTQPPSCAEGKDVSGPHPWIDPFSNAFDDVASRDATGNLTTVRQLRDDILRLKPEQRQVLADSYDVLEVNCPFSRANFQFLHVLRDEVNAISAVKVDPLVEEDWRAMQEGLRVRVQALDLLGITLDLPRKKDALYGKIPKVARVDIVGLASSEHALAITVPFLDQVNEIAEGLTDEQRATLQATNDQINQTLGHTTTGWPHLRGWYDTLRKAEPFVQDAEAKKKVAELLRAYTVLMDSGC